MNAHILWYYGKMDAHRPAEIYYALEFQNFKFHKRYKVIGIFFCPARNDNSNRHTGICMPFNIFRIFESTYTCIETDYTFCMISQAFILPCWAIATERPLVLKCLRPFFLLFFLNTLNEHKASSTKWRAQKNQHHLCHSNE